MENWLKKKIEEFKDDFEFRLESLILSITETISKSMKQRKISRTQLAERLNVSPPAVTKILNGSSNFTLKTLLSISDALDMDLVIDFIHKDAEIVIDDEVFFDNSTEENETQYGNAGFNFPIGEVELIGAANSTSIAFLETEMSKVA